MKFSLTRWQGDSRSTGMPYRVSQNCEKCKFMRYQSWIIDTYVNQKLYLKKLSNIFVQSIWNRNARFKNTYVWISKSVQYAYVSINPSMNNSCLMFQVGHKYFTFCTRVLKKNVFSDCFIIIILLLIAHGKHE